RAGHAQHPPSQAGGAAPDRDRDRRGLRHPVKERPSTLSRLSIRTRLALVYGAVFFCMGVGLIAVSYAIVDRSLSPAGTGDTVAQFVGLPGAASIGLLARQPPGMTGDSLPPGESLGALPPAADGPVPNPVAVRVGLEQLITDVRIQTLRSLLLTWAGVIGLMAIGAGLFGWLLAARMLKPLREITGTARRLSVANLHERIEFEG